MNFKRIFVFIIVLCFLFTVAGVSASDMNGTLGIDDSDDVNLPASSLDDVVSSENVSSIAESNNMDKISTTSQSNVKENSVSNNNVIDAKSAGKLSVILKPSPLKTTYGSGQCFQVKVIDSKTKKPVSNAKLLLKVYTGNKYKTVKISTNSKGIAKFSASKLNIGTHNIVVSSADRNVKAKTKKSSVKVFRATLIISAPKTTNAYKTGTFKVTVKNKQTKNPMSGIKVNIKVYTGKKYKTYSLKTNKKGEASINTKLLSKASHNVVITVKATKNYNARSAKSSIVIVNKLTDNKVIDNRIATFIVLSEDPYFHTSQSEPAPRVYVYSTYLIMMFNATLMDEYGNQLDGEYEIFVNDTYLNMPKYSSSSYFKHSFGYNIHEVHRILSGTHNLIFTIKYSGNDKYKGSTYTITTNRFSAR